jgi:Zn finger protein HypA/HybF involved in hydrogenase expression
MGIMEVFDDTFSFHLPDEPSTPRTTTRHRRHSRHIRDRGAMSAAWVLIPLLVPPIAALVAHFVLASREVPPALAIGLNALCPGAGLAAAGRPTLETVLGVLMAQASLVIAGTMGSIGYFVPFMVVGGFWASIYTPHNPLAVANGALDAVSRSVPEPPSAMQQGRSNGSSITPKPSKTNDDTDETVSGYAVEVRCTECGANVSVPVLQHMAHCGFCGSDHLLAGQEETLYLTLPEKTPTETELKEALLDHFRYQHYLRLFQASVPMIQAAATDATASGALVTRPEAEAAAAAAEAMVAKKADAYRAKLARQLQLGRTRRFLSPYRHGMGTLYQAGFGRRKEGQEKVLRFKIATIEASAASSSVLNLPEMGKLTYLRALRPAADCVSGERSLALDLDEEVLKRAFGRLDRKQLDRSIATIRLGSRFIREVSAVVWRPWWIVEVSGPRIHETYLVDSASGSVIGAAPTIDDDTLTELPESARDPGHGLHFIPMECPTCGHEFAFDSDAVVHFCHNCHRVCRVSGHRKDNVEYSRAGTIEEGSDLVPFWLFPLRIRTAGGELITDLAHLKDGIDGTLDQIGEDAPVRQHGLYVPAIRCINSKLMGSAFNRLFDHTVRQRFRILHERWPLDVKPRPWTIHLDEAEARNLVPLFLANAFGRRDLARVNVSQIADRLFDATQEDEGRLVYLPIPKVVTNPFRRYVGRFRGRALRKATKGG